MLQKKNKTDTKQPINEKLDDWESIKIDAQKIKEKEIIKIQEIRRGLVDCVVVFIDLVDSSKFKIQYKDEPEKWIWLIKQFSELVKKLIESNGGKVVKYIGDEVMGLFSSNTQIQDGIALIDQINKLELTLSKVTEFETKVKVSMDFGKVYLIKYEGHQELDPQGTPVDRCSRIGKFCEASTVLASADFISHCEFKSKWYSLGSVDLKGMGLHEIFQYKKRTIELKKMVLVSEEELKNLRNKINELTKENSEVYSKILIPNKLIQNSENSDEQAERLLKDVSWSEIKEHLKRIRRLIQKSRIPINEYGRFLYLSILNLGQKDDSLDGRDFETSKQMKIVRMNDKNEYILDASNQLNNAILILIFEAEQLLYQHYIDFGMELDDYLFNYSLSDAVFWKKYMHIIVS